MMTLKRAQSALFFAPGAYPLGGVQTWLDYVVPGLAGYGIEATVALCAGKHHVVSAYRDAHPSLPVVIVENPTGSRQGRVNAIAALVEERKPTYAISANIADTHWGVAQARRNSRAVRTRSVMSLHAIQADFVDEIGSSGDVIDAVVATNRLTCKLVEASGYARERIHYAPYGVSTAAIATVHARAALELGAEHPVRLAYVGRFEESQKRISLLAKLCDTLLEEKVSFELWLAGGGPDEAMVKSSLTAHTEAGRVRWLGHVPASDVGARVYDEVDILLNPSFWETGPIVAWEAMAKGVVVVSTRYVGSGQEGALLDGVNCRLFEIDDAAGAALAIRSLCSSAARATIRATAKSLVESRYSLDASVRAWANCLHQILQLPERPIGATQAPAAGRLDKAIGTEMGERIRRSLGIRFSHEEPGSEWPHSYGRTADSKAFWAGCADLDRAEFCAGSQA
jgi:glycosyltransferase involved in cell wall biosynthesis